MIWMSWRQFRPQAVAAVVGLAAIGGYLVFLGMRIRSVWDDNRNCDGCTEQDAINALRDSFGGVVQLSSLLIVVAPIVIGAFWGAPLIARELETGTFRLVWNQSVTRRRWLTVKLAMVAVAGVVLTGALSVVMTWAASPFDRVLSSRYDLFSFPARNIAPFGYALFAVVLGAAIGLLARRTVLAMAITLVVVAGMQILMPALVRAHLQTPVSESVTLTAEMGERIDGVQGGKDGVSLVGYSDPNDWVLVNGPLMDSAGNKVGRDLMEACMTGDPGGDFECLAAKDLHFEITYHPGSSYWTFQWIETGIYTGLALLLAGVCFWRIRRRVG